MGEDILPSVPTSLALSALNSLLALLTHRSPLLRRLSYLVLLFLAFNTLTAIVSLRSHVNRPRASRPSALDVLDLAAAREEIRIRSQFEEKALGSDSSRVVGVTAVVLHWKRRKGLELVLKHITRYPFIREVIVWNNRGGVELLPKDFVLSAPPGSDSGPPLLRIYNSPANVHDAGKHFACSLASYKHCYFNDDDWLNIYMDSLYVKYLECCAGGGGVGRGGSGGRIASNTMPIIHLEHRRWRFSNPDIALHTGFTWLGTGAFSPRALSARFLAQQAAAPVPLGKDQARVADMFFSLWTNSFPEQMPNDLVPIDVEGGEVGWSRGTGIDQWSVVYSNILTAIRSLHSILSLESPALSPDPFPRAASPPESHARAPCANDGCLFSTSLTPFPPPSALVYPPGRIGNSWWAFWTLGGEKGTTGLAGEHREGRFDPWRLRNVQEHEKMWKDVPGGWPEDEWWVRNGSWHLAVDGKGAETCWESWRPPDELDHFGLTLVAPRLVKEIRLIGSNDLENIVAWENTGATPDAWELLTVREDGSGGWEPRRLRTFPQVRPLGPSRVEVTLSLEPLADFYGEDVAVRKIKFVSRGKKQQRLSLCGFQLDEWTI